MGLEKARDRGRGRRDWERVCVIISLFIFWNGICLISTWNTAGYNHTYIGWLCISIISFVLRVKRDRVHMHLHALKCSHVQATVVQIHENMEKNWLLVFFLLFPKLEKFSFKTEGKHLQPAQEGQHWPGGGPMRFSSGQFATLGQVSCRHCMCPSYNTMLLLHNMMTIAITGRQTSWRTFLSLEHKQHGERSCHWNMDSMVIIHILFLSHKMKTLLQKSQIKDKYPWATVVHGSDTNL